MSVKAKDHPIPDQLCPHCGHGVTHAGALIEKTAAPRPGDWSVCIRCGEVAVFDVGLRQRKPDPIEAAAAALDRKVLRARAAIRLGQRTVPGWTHPGTRH